MATTESTPRLLPVPSDVAGGGLVVLLTILQTLVVPSGGLAAFVALLVVWPLVGGGVASFFSTDEDRAVDGAVAGVFASLTTTLLVLLTGFVGAWPAFVTSNVGVSLWPVTFATLVATMLTWTVFGYLGAVGVERAA